MEVERSDVKLPVNALGNAGHLGVAVPIELLPVWHQHKEKRKLGFHLDRQCNDGVRFS